MYAYEDNQGRHSNLYDTQNPSPGCPGGNHNNCENGSRPEQAEDSDLYKFSANEVAEARVLLFQIWSDCPPPVPGQEPLMSPEEVLNKLETTPGVRRFIKRRLRQGVKLGTFTVHDREEFKASFYGYADGKKNGQGQTLSAENVEEEWNKRKPEAYNDNGDIHFDASRSSKTTYVHESLHSFCNQEFASMYPAWLVEGITEYLTKKVCTKNKLDYQANAYTGEMPLVETLINILGENAIKRAYFQGDCSNLESKITGNLPSGTTFSEWLANLQTIGPTAVFQLQAGSAMKKSKNAPSATSEQPVD